MIESAPPAPYTVRPMDPAADREPLLRLWARNMSDQRIAAVVARRFRWLYEDNPGGAARTWLIVSPAGDIVGCGSVVPREMSVRGERVRGGVLADFAVEREHRSVGPAIQLQRAIIEAVRQGELDFVYGWPNDKSRGVIKRAGYVIAGESGLWTKLLRSQEQILKRASRIAAFPAGTVALRMVAVLADMFMRGADAVHLLSGTFRWHTEVLQRADVRFDELWRRAPRPCIVGCRNASYLNWRYSDFTTADYRFLLLSERSGARRPVAYAVYTIRDGHAVIADFFCEDVARQLAPLLLQVSFRVRAEGASQVSLNYIGPGALPGRLRALQFFRRGSGRAFIVSVRDSAPEPLKQAICDAQQWFMFDGELDI